VTSSEWPLYGVLTMNTRLIPMQFSQSKDDLNLLFNPPARYVHFGSYDLDRQRQELFRYGVRVPLPRKVFEVLLILIEKPGDVVTREALRARLWPPDSHVNYNANVNTTVNKLRQVLGDSTNQPAFVETVPRRGYAFIARTEYSNQPSAHESGAQVAADSESRARPLPESPFQVARQSAWFAVGVVAVLMAGILVGAIAVYMAMHP
jgi:DNA-binding winged helix-turn-helix (wHTH) protein